MNEWGAEVAPGHFVIRTHGGKPCVAVIDTEADAPTGFEPGDGEPVVGDFHPREMRLSVRLGRPWIKGVLQDTAAMLVLGCGTAPVRGVV